MRKEASKEEILEMLRQKGVDERELRTQVAWYQVDGLEQEEILDIVHEQYEYALKDPNVLEEALEHYIGMQQDYLVDTGEVYVYGEDKQQEGVAYENRLIQRIKELEASIEAKKNQQS